MWSYVMVKQLNVSLHGLESLRLIAWGIVIVLLSLIAYVKTAHAFEDRSVHHLSLIHI